MVAGSIPISKTNFEFALKVYRYSKQITDILVFEQAPNLLNN